MDAVDPDSGAAMDYMFMRLDLSAQVANFGGAAVRVGVEYLPYCFNDTDEDGFGNGCDCDIDGEEGGNGEVNYADFQVFRAAYGSHGLELIAGGPGQSNTYTDASENWNADADFDGDLNVNYEDYQIFRGRYGASVPFE